MRIAIRWLCLARGQATSVPHRPATAGAHVQTVPDEVELIENWPVTRPASADPGAAAATSRVPRTGPQGAAMDDTLETDVEHTHAELMERLTVVDSRDCHTEAFLYSDDTIAVYVRNGGESVTAVYWLDQARALHEALGHLLWRADHPTPAQLDE